MMIGILIVCAALGFVVLYSGMMRKRNIHLILGFRAERSKLEKELETLLSDRKILAKEVDELEERLKGVQSNTASLSGGGDPAPSASKPAQSVKDPKQADKDAASWLLKSGQLTLEQYEKVESYVSRSSKEITFVSACLILGLITRDAAEQATRQ